MINFHNGFLSYESKATIRNVVEHLNYVKNSIGVDHVGIGSDYDGVDTYGLKIVLAQCHITK